MSLIANIIITSSQLKNLVDSPITLIPAQGHNTFIILDSVAMSYIYGTKPYINGNNIQVIWDNSNIDVPCYGQTISDSILKGTSNALIVSSGMSNTNWYIQYPTTAEINTGIILYNSVNFEDGDGTIKFFINYHVITL